MTTIIEQLLQIKARIEQEQRDIPETSYEPWEGIWGLPSDMDALESSVLG